MSYYYADYADYDLEGGREPSAWNKYVKANYDSVRHLPARQRLGALAQAARAAGIIGKSAPKKASACAKKSQSSCTAPCVWSVPKGLTKKGKARKPHCRSTRMITKMAPMSLF